MQVTSLADRRLVRCRAAAMIALGALLIPASACGTEEHVDLDGEHAQPSSARPLDFDGAQVWFYEATGKLEAMERRGGTVEAVLVERGRRQPVRAQRASVDDPATRAEGYRQAMAQTIEFLKPGALADNPENRAWLEQRVAWMQQVTGLSLQTGPEWRAWLDANGARLRWSDRAQRLEVAEGATP